MDVNKKKTVILFFLFVLAAQHTCFAQQPSLPADITKIRFSLQGHISLDSLTRYVHRHSSIRFSFNSLKVKGSNAIDFPKGVYTLPDLLAQIRKATTLYYSYYNGYVIFQDNPPKKQQHTPNKIHTVPKKPVAKSKPVPERVITSPANVPKDSIAQKMVAGDTARRQPAVSPVKNEPLPPKKNTANNATKKNPAVAGQRSSPALPAAGGKERLALSLHYGLLLDVNIPLQGFSNYFTGTNGNSQPYNLLIPGAWVSLILGDKHELTLAAKPAQQYFTHKTTLTAVRDSASIRDSVPAMRTTALIKISGLYMSVLYHYHFNDNWVAGAGIEYHWVGSALLNRQKYIIFNNQAVYDSTIGIKKTDADWQLLKSSFITGRIELAYQTGSLRVGLAVVVPLTNISAAPGVNIRTLDGQVFLRWDIRNLLSPQPSTD